MNNIIIVSSTPTYTGAVILSPSGIVTVCSGDQLELICTLTDPGSSLLEWRITSTTSISVQQAIEAATPSDQISHFIVNSTSFTTSRISAQGQLPLVSRLLINPVTIGLNGTVVDCTDGIIATVETASAIVSVISIRGRS